MRIGVQDEETYHGNTVLLSTIAVLLVLLTQIVNFIDAIYMYCTHSTFVSGTPYRYTSFIFSSVSLAIAVISYIVICKFSHYKPVKISAMFLIYIYCMIYTIEIQLYSTGNNVPLALFR